MHRQNRYMLKVASSAMRKLAEGSARPAQAYNPWLSRTTVPDYGSGASGYGVARKPANSETYRYSSFVPEMTTRFDPVSGQDVPVATGNLVQDEDELLGGAGYRRNYTTDYADPAGRYRIYISGAGSKPGYDLDSRGDQDTSAIFRYVDAQYARKYIQDLMDKGVTQFQLIGHSRGGDVADDIGAWLQEQGLHPDVHLIDPVSRDIFHRNKKVRSNGATVYLPKDSGGWNNLVANVGGRFARVDNPIMYDGDHSDIPYKILRENTDAWVKRAPAAQQASPVVDMKPIAMTYTKALRGH